MNKNIKALLIILLIGIIVAGIMWGIAVKVCKGNKNKQIVEYDLDKIYSSEAASGYTDIRNLREDYDMDYNIGEAQKDRCLVVGAMVHNEDVYIEFNEKYKRKETAFIRVVQHTSNGETYIIDVFYDSVADKTYVVTDRTRDSSIEDNERKNIKLDKYEHIGIWQNEKYERYWAVYNGELPTYGDGAGKISSGNLYLILRIG